MKKNNFPRLVESFFSHYWKDEKHLAYFYFTKEGFLTEFGGDVECYFPGEIVSGIAADELTPLLTGLLPFDEPKLVLPNIEFREQFYIDIHILNDSKENVFCVLFIDMSHSVNMERKVHEARDELHLMAQKHKTLMRQYVGDPIVSRILQGKSSLNKDGERKEICTLFADVRAFTSITERYDSQEVIYILNQYLKIMIEAVLENGGVVDKIMGDGLMVLFGLLPDQEKNMSELAYAASVRIQQEIHNMIHERRSKDLHLLGVGIGITTGQVVLGVLGNKSRQMFSAIGRHVNTAQRLESQARPGEILLDENTYKALRDSPKDLNKIEMQLRNVNHPIVAYSCQYKE